MSATVRIEQEDDDRAPGRFPAGRMLAVLTVFVFINYLDRYALSILLEPIKEDLQLSDLQVGLLTGIAFALLYSTLALPVARLAEHRNRVHVVTAALIIWSLGTALCGAAGSFYALLFARILVGAGEAGAIAPAQSMVGDGFPLARRGTALAILSTGGALGTALAPAIGGALEAWFGWRGAFIALGLLGLPVALLMAAMLKDPPRGLSDGLVAPAEAPPSFGNALRRLFGRRSFSMLFPALIAIGIAEYSLFLWLPSYLARSFGDSTAAIGSQLTIFQGLPLLAGTLLGGVILDRLVPRDRRWICWLPAVALLVAAPSIWLLFSVTSKTLVLALLILPSLVCGLYLAPCYSAIQALAGARSRATATALLTLGVNLIGLGLGPVVLGALSDYLSDGGGTANSLRQAFLIVPPLYLFAGIVLLLASRHIRRDMDDARAESLGN